MVARGLCSSHHRQLLRTGELTPLRTGPALVKLPGTALRLKKDTVKRICAEARRRGVTVSDVVRKYTGRLE